MQDSWSDRLSAYTDNEMSAEERVELEDHLAVCESCRTILEELRGVTDWADSFPGRAPRSEVWPEIEEEIAKGGRSDAGGEAKRGGFWGAMAAGLAAMIPFGTAVGSTFLKNGIIVGLVGVSLAGMGRSVYLQRNADMMETKADFLDGWVAASASAVDWSTTASDLEGETGVRYALQCLGQGSPENRREYTVWGSGLYTDDSSICTAAVHAGSIEFETGGLVTIELRDGVDRYEGTDRNGVSTASFPRWRRSFRVVSAQVAGNTQAGPGPLYFYDENDAPNEETEYLSGDMVINVGSMRDALRAGRMLMREGRLNQIELAREQLDAARLQLEARREQFEAQHGESSGGFAGELDRLAEEQDRLLMVRERLLDTSPEGDLDERVVDRMMASTEGVGRIRMDLEPELIDWETRAVSMRGWNGSIVAYACPAGGELHAVWGTTVYTDDSSICSAAVHAGVINRREGGVVVIQISGGMDGYESSDANGVSSRDWHEFNGSFSFPRALNR